MARQNNSRTPKQNTRQRTIAEAVVATRRLKRPPSITQRTWHGVHAVLIELARHLPDPFPSEERLAERTGYTSRSVRRYLRAAEEAGLVQTESFQHGRGWRHNRYLLMWLNSGQFVLHSDGQTVPLTVGTLRVPPEPTYGGKVEPPTAALAAAPTRTSNPLEAQPVWLTGFDPAQQLGLPPDTVWKPNLFPGQCSLCRHGVPAQGGWVAPPVYGVKWFLVHDEVCPRLVEGRRPGQGLQTAGEIGTQMKLSQHRAVGYPL